MTRPLVYLWLTTRANAVRRFGRNCLRPRRLATTLVTLAAVGFIVWTMVEGARTADVKGDAAPGLLASFLGMLLLLSLFGGFAERGIAFSPAEVDFLFPAPFRRTSLVLHHLAGLYPASWVMVLVPFALFGVRMPNPALALVGILLCDLVCQHVRLVAAILAIRVSERVFRRLKTPLAVLMVVGFLALVTIMIPPLAGAGGPAAALRGALSSTLAQAAFYPAKAAVELGLATSLGEALSPLLGSLGVFLGTLALLLALPVDFLEAALAASQRAASRRARARSGRAFGAAAEGRRPAAVRLPSLRVFRGAGAVFWKNLVYARRSGRSLLFSILFELLFILPVVLSGERGPWWALAMGAFFPLFLGTPLSFDFRGEKDHMSRLKTLPVSSTRLAAAEVAGPALVALVFQALLLAGFVAVDRLPLTWAPVALAAYAPLTAGLVAVSNLAHLLASGRLLAQVLQTAFVLADAVVLWATASLLRSLDVPWALLAPVLLAEQVGAVLAVLWLVGRAFRAYDVSFEGG